MKLSTEKVDLFASQEENIRQVCKTDEEIKKTVEVLHKAEEQSKQKIIRVTRKVEPVRKFFVLWRNRFKYGIHWKKPFYPLRLIRNVLLGKLYNFMGKKKYVLRGIEFAATYACNFRCSHCLCSRIDESDKRKELIPDEYRVIVKDAMKLGATTFGLEGGEAFILKNWDEIVEAWRPHYNHIIISTNGFLFDEKRAKRCAELGVDTINFSLDSGYAELHNVFRKMRHSYERVMTAIKLCRKYKIKIIINTTVHKGNLYTDGFRELLEFAEREKILLNTLLAKGVGSFKDKEAMLDDDDLKAFAKIVEPYAYVQRHLNYNYGKQWGCPGTKEMINMTPYGDVMNCANMHIYFGNVLTEPLAKIRDRALKNTPFGRYHVCFLAEDKDFMNIYYPNLDQNGYMSIDQFKAAVKEYSITHNKDIYSELWEKK